MSLSGSLAFIEKSATLRADDLTIISPDAFSLISGTIKASQQTYSALSSLTSKAGNIVIGNAITEDITIDEYTTIRSNASGNDDAGSILISSSNNITFYGTATAKAKYGNGGYIALSSEGTIAHGDPLNISVTSTFGESGTLLINQNSMVIADDASAFSAFQALLLSGNTNPTPEENAVFGSSVVLSDNYALINAPLFGSSSVVESGNVSLSDQDSSVWLFDLTSGVWTNILASSTIPLQLQQEETYQFASS